MNSISVIIRPVSSVCNLCCRYCFCTDSATGQPIPEHGAMTIKTMETVIRRMALFLNNHGEIHIAFRGGEPVLIGLPFFEKLVSIMKEYPQITPYYTLRTNGILINEQWARFLHGSNFRVEASMDIIKTIHDRYRIDNTGGSYDRTVKGIKYLRTAAVDHSILTVITDELLQNTAELVRSIQKNDFRIIRFITDQVPEQYGRFMDDLHSLLAEKGYSAEIDVIEPHDELFIESNADIFVSSSYPHESRHLGNLRRKTLEQIINDDAGMIPTSSFHKD